jgi:hypothetical protein
MARFLASAQNRAATPGRGLYRDENAICAHAFHFGRSKDMQRRCFNQTTTLDERPEEQAERLRKEAEGKPPFNLSVT